MKFPAVALALVLGLGSSISFAQSAFVVRVHSSHAELRHMMRTAHTPEQYQQLAASMRQRQMASDAKAAEEQQLWQQREQTIAASTNKYPRPVDSARYLYEYYAGKADREGQLAAHYEQLAANVTPASN
jgi:hypothetical protein